MANAGVKTLLQSKEIREAMDPLPGSQTQPPAPRPLLGPAAPQAFSKHAAISSPGPPGAEFSRNSAPQNCYSLKRTFASTNLLLLSLASPDDSTDREASLSLRVHTSCSQDKSEPTVPMILQDYREFTVPRVPRTSQPQRP